jgi:hypothetical protein
MTNSKRRLRWLSTSINATGRGREHLTKRYFFARNIFWFEFVEIRSDKASKE